VRPYPSPDGQAAYGTRALYSSGNPFTTLVLAAV